MASEARGVTDRAVAVCHAVSRTASERTRDGTGRLGLTGKTVCVFGFQRRFMHSLRAQRALTSSQKKQPPALTFPLSPLSPNRQAPLRPQASWFRRTDQTCVPQKGEDDEENRASFAVQHVQSGVHAPAETMQDL